MMMIIPTLLNVNFVLLWGKYDLCRSRVLLEAMYRQTLDLTGQWQLEYQATGRVAM